MICGIYRRQGDGSLVFEITKEQADKINNYINDFDDEYNMVLKNCTTFAVEALKSAGIAPPTKEHDWELPKEINKMVEEQLHFGKFNGIVRSIEEHKGTVLLC